MPAQRRPTLFAAALTVVALATGIALLDEHRVHEQRSAESLITVTVRRINYDLKPDVVVAGTASEIRPPWWITGPVSVWNAVVPHRWAAKLWQWDRYRVVTAIDIRGSRGSSRVIGVSGLAIALKKCTFADDVMLDGTDCDDACLESIHEIGELESLSLSRTLVSDQGVRSISNLRNLKMLTLSETAITDDCVPALGKMKRLVLLAVGGTSITKRGVRNLQVLLPECMITTDVTEDD